MKSAQLKTQQKLLTIISVLFLIISLLLGVQMVLQRQLGNKKAATPNGTITMNLSGPTEVQVGQSLSIPINFVTSSTPNNQGINVMQVLLTYTNTAAFSITPQNIVGNLNSSWNYTKTVTPGNTQTEIYIEAYYNVPGTSGYIPTPNETFATLNFQAVSPGTLTLVFDTNQSKALSFGNAVDILNSSLSSKTLTVSQPATVTPTPTQQPQATVTPTPTNNPQATVTPTQQPEATVTPTPSPTSGTNTAEPNNCNGTCGSNQNCKGGLACLGGFCRNPLDPGSTTCVVRTPTPTKRPTVGANTTPKVSTPTKFPTYSPLPTIVPIDLFPTTIPEITPAPTPDVASSSFAVRLLTVIGMWLLVILLIVWLIKKYRDSQSKDKTINDLVNRFKTPEPPSNP